MALVAALFACLEAGRGFGEVGADTLVVSRFGAGSLPYLFVGLGTVGLVTSLAYGAALGRFERIRLLSGILAGAAAILLVERLLMATGHPATVPLAWLTVYTVGAIGVTIAWTMAGSVFDARQARRLFPLCTGAAIAGSFVGTLASGSVARAYGTETLILLEAGLLALVGLLVVAVARTTTVRAPVRRRDRSVIADLGLGFGAVLHSPLMRLVAVAYVLLAILMFSVTYPFLSAASEAFRSEADLASALGLLSAAVTATSFVVSLVLANRAYARFGVAGAALLLPLVYLGGFTIWLVAFSVSTAFLFRFVQQVTQRGISNAAFSAFYNVVPRERRAQVLAFNDGVPGQVGTILSGVLLLAAGSLFARDQVFLLGAATAVVCTIVAIGIRRRYRASVVDSLRAGLAEQVLEGGPGLLALTADPAVVDTLVDALAAPEPGIRRTAAGLLAQASMDRAGPALIRTVDDDDDPGVRVAALQALASVGGPPTAVGAAQACLLDADESVRAAAVRTMSAIVADPPSVLATMGVLDELTDDPSPAVRGALACLLVSRGPDPRTDALVAGLLSGETVAARVAGLRAIARIGRQLEPDVIRLFLADPSIEVRVATVEALAAAPDAAAADRDLIAALDDEAAAVRSAAAAALSAREVTPAGLVDLLTTGSTRSQAAALIALRGHGPGVRQPVIAWTRGRLEQAAGFRSARLDIASPVADGDERGPILAFLTAVLARRELVAIGDVLGSLVVLGNPEAGGVIRRSLSSSDPETRAQAIEALDTIGDRALSGTLVGLLDDAGAAASDRLTTLSRLADDDDPWIARLARLLMTTGATMPDTSNTIADIDTMLFLRRVPLFEALDPEDLQRVASVAVEHVYPAGEALVREGEYGDDLVIIVEGSVRVVRAEPDGSERLIRRYAPGDHIGELAVLRDAPRAATVIAEDGPVRGLVIGGEGLRAILRERPEAAMALLATLAERISRQ